MKQTFYLFNPGVLERKDNTLKFTAIAEDGNGIETLGKPKFLPVEQVSDIYVFGSLKANSALFNFLGQKDIAVHFFDYYENYTGSFMPRDSVLSGKLLLAQTAAYQNKKKRLEIARKFIEGAAFNMVKNLKYYDNRGKDLESLSLDISEIFKPIIVDRVIFKVLNKKMIQPQHFDHKLNSCLLNQSGKKIFVQAMEERYKETIKHKSLGRNVSYKHLIKLECYKLVKHLLGIEEYKPFKMYW